MPNAKTDESIGTQMQNCYLHDNDEEHCTAFLALKYYNQGEALRDYAIYLNQKDQSNGTPVPVQNIF